MPTPSEDKSLQRIQNQVNKTLEVSDVLSGRKEIGGKLGDKLKKKQVDERDIGKGKETRIKKFKGFDDWCDRLEDIVNPTGQRQIKIKRALIVKEQEPNKSI
ncbi:hypothetical protein NIES4103_31280 [Nostoc sp. NIES-4103]|nr:hypothetical protein NIES4103_31280 [Nostoc sp. NIES-4103]